MDMKYLA